MGINYSDDIIIAKDNGTRYNIGSITDLIQRHSKVLNNSSSLSTTDSGREELLKSLNVLNILAQNEFLIKNQQIVDPLISLAEPKILESLSSNSSLTNNNLKNILSVSNLHVKNKELLRYIKCRLLTHYQQRKESLEWMLETDSECLDCFLKSKFSNSTIEKFIGFQSETIDNNLYKNVFISDEYMLMLEKTNLISDKTKEFRNKQLSNLYNFKYDKSKDVHVKQKELNPQQEDQKMFSTILKESLNQSLKISAAAVVNEQVCEIAKSGLEKLGLPEEMLDNKVLTALLKSVIPVTMMYLSSRGHEEGEFSSDLMEKVNEMSQLALQDISVETMDEVMSVVLPAVKSLVSSEEFKQLKEPELETV